MGDHHDIPGNRLADGAAPFSASAHKHLVFSFLIEEQSLERRKALRRDTVLDEHFRRQIGDTVFFEKHGQTFRRRVLALRPVRQALSTELLPNRAIMQEFDLRPGIGGGEIGALQSLETHLVGSGAEFRPGFLLRIGGERQSLIMRNDEALDELVQRIIASARRPGHGKDGKAKEKTGQGTLHSDPR